MNKKNNYQLVIYRKNNNLVGKMYENEDNIVCQSNDVSFWLNKYYNVIQYIQDDNILCVYFSPLINKYKAMIIKRNYGFYNKYRNELIKEIDGLNLDDCLYRLNISLGLENVRKLTKKKNDRYYKRKKDNK